MANKVIRFLGGREGEQKRITLLLLMGFFMGIFLATLQVPAETLITALGAEYLDVAFLVGGGLGIVSAAAYVYAQRHIPFSVLAVLNTFLIALAMVGVRMSFFYIDHSQASFVLFVMMGPVSSITLLSFWGIFGRIFDVRSSKRIIGGIDTGQLSATCLAFFAISILSDYIDTLNILWISAISSIGVCLLSIRIVSSYKLERAVSSDLANLEVKKASARKKEKSQISYLDLFKNKYFLMLSLFLVFSVCASKFNEFSYRTSMFTWFADNEVDLNRTYSLIDAIIIVVSFLVQSFLNDYIIGRYGLKISLMLMPILLGLFTVGAIFSGHLFGYDIESGNFFIFFTFTVMGRILAASLRDALENPAFKMFFFPVEERDRFDIQSRIEGVVNEFAALMAGAALIGLGLLEFFNLIHFSYLLILLVAGAIFMPLRLFDQYKITLKSSLMQQKKKLKGRSLQIDSSLISILGKSLQSRSAGVVTFTLKLTERLEPMLLRKYVLQALRSPSAAVRAFAYRKCAEINNIEYLEDIQKAASAEPDPKVSEIAAKTVAKLSRSKEYNPSAVEFSEMLRSRDSETRKFAAQLLVKFPGGRHSTFLIELLRDAHPEVRRAAIITAGQLKMPDYWTSIIGSLHMPAYANTCRSALSSCGKAVYQTVDMLFYRTNQRLDTMFRVVQILGRIGGPEGLERIWKKIDYPNSRIFNECLFSLSYNAYRTRDIRAARLRIQIEENIGKITWNIRVMLQIPKKHPVDTLLVAAIEEENKQTQQDLFMLMAMVYDPQSVQLVKENVEFGTPESLTYAIELMNVFLDETIKPKVFLLFDDLRPEERISRLSAHYVPEFFKNYEDALLQIVNQDYTRIGRWVKSLAIYRLASLPEARITPDLVANIFNPDMFLLQVTAFVLYQKDKREYRRQTLRIASKVAKQLDTVLLPPVHLEKSSKWSRPLLLVERTIFFKQVPSLAGISGDVLTELSELATERNYKADQTIVAKGEQGEQPVRVLLRGRIKKHDQTRSVGYMEKYDVIGLHSLVAGDTYQHDYTAVEATTCLEIELDDFFSLMGMRIRLVEAMIEYVQEGGREEQRKRVEKKSTLQPVTE